MLASSTLFPSTASALTAVVDTPVPDAAASAGLAVLLPRLRAVEASQRAQAAEMAELRSRSEVAVRHWYESSVVGYGAFVADVEGRVEGVERDVRRVERLRREDV